MDYQMIQRINIKKKNNCGKILKNSIKNRMIG